MLKKGVFGSEATRRLLGVGALGFAVLTAGCGKERERGVPEEAAGPSARERFVDGAEALRATVEEERAKPREVGGCLVVRLSPGAETVFGPACVHVPGPLRLERGSLRIEPGTTVKMAPGAELVVAEEAWLVARGTAGKPIVFESAEGSGKAGDWKRLGLSGHARSELAHVVVRHGGGGRGTLKERGAVVVARPLASFDDVTIEDSREHGLVLLDGAEIEGGGRVLFRNIGKESIAAEADGLRALPSSITLDDGDQAVLVATREVLSHPATWPNLGVPYRLEGDLRLQAPLALDAGVILEMKGRLSVARGGSLETRGTAAAPVVWRGLDPVKPRGGALEGLDLGRGTSRLAHLRIEHAGKAGGELGSILEVGETSLLEGLEIRASFGDGLRLARCPEEATAKSFCALSIEVSGEPVTCGPKRKPLCPAR